MYVQFRLCLQWVVINWFILKNKISIYYIYWLKLEGDTHMTSSLRGGLVKNGGRGRKKWDVIGYRGWRVSECSGRPIFIFFIKENWICAMNRHDEPKINILLTRNLPFDSDVRQWSHNTFVKILSVFLLFSRRPIFIFFFFVKENWICPMARDHTELKSNIWLTRNLQFDSDVRQWSHNIFVKI